MIKILFICLGNICRSPMAEFVFKDMVEKRGLASQFQIASAAVSSEETGNPVHPGTRRKLREKGISVEGKFARQMNREDYRKYDYLIGMDQGNIRGILRIVGEDADNKVCRLLDFSQHPRDIADPWYTHNFDVTYDDIYEGCQCLLDYILRNSEKER